MSAKHISLFIIVSVIVFFGLYHTAQSAHPEDHGLSEGDAISAIGAGDPDVYIINKTHVRSYKRVFANPEIFNMYPHIGFNKVKTVTPEVRDDFPTSALFRVDGGEAVYCLEMTGEDTARLLHVTATGEEAVEDDSEFFLRVFNISEREFDWYSQGPSVALPSDCPEYQRTDFIADPTPTPNTIATCPVQFSNIGKPVDSTSGTFRVKQAVFLLADNHTGADVLTTLPANELVHVQHSDHGYYYISYGGHTGYTWHTFFDCTN